MYLALFTSFWSEAPVRLFDYTMLCPNPIPSCAPISVAVETVSRLRFSTNVPEVLQGGQQRALFSVFKSSVGERQARESRVAERAWLSMSQGFL